MARAYLKVYFDGKLIRCYGGNNLAVRELRYQYRINPEKFHPWMQPYPGYTKYFDKISLVTEFNR